MHQTLFTNDGLINANALKETGIYLLQLSDENGYTETIKLVKTK